MTVLVSGNINTASLASLLQEAVVPVSETIEFDVTLASATAFSVSSVSIDTLQADSVTIALLDADDSVLTSEEVHLKHLSE